MPSSSGERRARMLDQAEIDAALHEVAAIARAEGVRVALAGGVALQRLGSTRFTADVDFVAEGPLKPLPTLKRLTFGGYVSRTPGGVPVDVIVRSDDYATLYQEALEHARRDGEVYVVGPEYLAAMKLVARRAKDRADLEFMVLERVFNLAKARRIIRRHLGAYALEDFDAFVAVARWRAGRDA